MKKTTKRILLSVITLVLVVVALGTTTFAWFTLSQTATVSDITGTVQAGEGLEIGFGIKDATEPLAGIGYKTNLTSVEWGLLMDDEAYSNFEFGAVSTDDGSTFKTLVVAATQDVQNKTKLEKTEAPLANAEKSYLEFTLQFKSDTEGDVHWMDYSFDETSVFTFKSGVEFVDGKGNLVSADTNIDFNAANAARIAIFGANETVVVQKAEDGGMTSNDNTANNEAMANGQFSYLKAKGNVIDWGNGVLDGSDLTSVNMLEARESLTTSTGDKVATLTGTAGNYTASVTIRVWLEGWDADMYDAIFRTVLNFNLEFQKA